MLNKLYPTKFWLISFALLTLIAVVVGVAFVQPSATVESVPDFAAAKSLQAAPSFGELPLAFEVNRGQSDAAVKFLSRGQGYALFLTAREAVFTLGGRAEQQRVLRMRLDNAAEPARIVGQNRLAGNSNYFVGADASRWLRDVPTFGAVRYESVYAGVDQIFYGNGRELEYDFVVAPGADYKQIAVDFAGADNLELDAAGALIVWLGDEQVVQRKPVVYQEINGEKRFVAANYEMRDNNKIGFAIGDYDGTKPLTIDPVLVYSTYLGGNESDNNLAVALDAEKNVYATGYTNSTTFPVVNPVQSGNGGNFDVIVTKINAAGTAIVYSTYLGGSAGESGEGIDVDAAGNVYVTGNFNGVNAVIPFPTTENAFDRAGESGGEAFLFKLNPSGNALVYSTFTRAYTTSEVKVNRRTGEAFVTGLTYNNLPTTPGAFRSTCEPNPCAGNAFVQKFNAAGSNLIYSTYVGGNGGANDMAIDAAGFVYLTGGTSSATFPITPGAAQSVCRGCEFQRSDAFVTKLDQNGSALVYSTFLGGSLNDVANGIVIDAAGNAYVTGSTSSSSTASAPFPVTPGAFQTTSLGIPEGFVTKVNSTGTAFIYSTYLGGDVTDSSVGIAVDRAGNAHVTGQTASRNFPLVNAVQSACTANGSCASITSLNANGSALLFSTFFGQGEGREIVADDAGNIYAVGQSYPGLTNTPLVNPIQSTRRATEGYIAKIFVQELPPIVTATIGGRITTAGGRQAPNVFVTLLLPDGSTRVTPANPFGYYRFSDVPINSSVVVSVAAKNFSFAPNSQTVLVGGGTGDINFTASSRANFDSSKPMRSSRKNR